MTTTNNAINNFLGGFTSTITSGTTTILTATSSINQYFTGTMSQTVQLPVVDTLVLGQAFYMVNESTAVINIISSGGNLVQSITPNATAYISCILTSGTSDASWFSDIYGASTDLFPNGLINVTTTTQTIVPGTQYLINSSGGQCTLSLPTIAPKGSFFGIIGSSPSGWIVQCGTSQKLIVGILACTTSTGYFASIAPSATVIFECIVANQTWQAVSITGNLEDDTSAKANAIDAPFPFAINIGGTGVQTLPTSPAASAYAAWDANKNLSGNNVLEGFTTTITAAGTTTLTVASTYTQVFTGTTTQTVQLPVTSTLVLGQAFYIINNSTGIVTVTSSGGNTVLTLPASSTGYVTCILTSGTTAASWYGDATGTGTDLFPNGTQVVIGSTQTIVNGTSYVADAAGIVTFTLPGSVIGTYFSIVGVNGWQLNVGTGNVVTIGNTTLVGGVGNYWASSNVSDAVIIQCIGANTWQSVSVSGNPGTNGGLTASFTVASGNGILVSSSGTAKVINVNPITLPLFYTSGLIPFPLSSYPFIYATYAANTGNATLSNPTNPLIAGVYTLHFKQNASTAYTLSFDTQYKFPQGVVPVASTALNAVDVYTFLYDGTNMLCIGISQNIS